MSHHRRTQPHSHIAWDPDICVDQVYARIRKWGPCKEQGHCWAGKADEVPTNTIKASTVTFNSAQYLFI